MNIEMMFNVFCEINQNCKKTHKKSPRTNRQHISYNRDSDLPTIFSAMKIEKDIRLTCGVVAPTPTPDDFFRTRPKLPSSEMVVGGP